MGVFGRTLLIFSITSSLVSVVCGESCEMLATAGDAFSVKFETDRRGQLKSLDTIEVIAYFSDIVDKSCEDDLVLNMEMPNGSWQEVDAHKQNKKDRKQKSRYFLWKVEDIIPCRTNRFQLVSGEHSIEAELAPAELLDLEDFEFAPGKPQNTVYANDKLSWDALECATGYRVEIFNIISEEEVMNVIVNENKVSLAGLEYCDEFEYFLYPLIGEFESSADENYGEFTKEPNYDLLSALAIEAEATTDTAEISWGVTNEIICVDKYEVELCEADDDQNCQTEIVYNPDEEHVFQVTLKSLKPGTAYQISLSAVYKGATYYRDVKKLFNTKIDMDLFNVEAIADFESVTISWSEVSIAQSYILYRHLSGGEWGVLADIVGDAMYESHEEPCMDIKYAIAVITSDMDYDMKESNTVNLKLDESLPFSPSEQSVVMFADGATLSWTHLACIAAYKVSVCTDVRGCLTNLTQASDIVEGAGLFLELEDLTPCTSYTIHIVPQIAGKSWAGGALILEETTEQLLEPPAQETLQVEEWTPSTPVRISWDNTNCAEEYEVYFEDTMDENSYSYQTAKEDSVEFDREDRNSCSEYMFQIASMAGSNRSEESAMGHFFVGPTAASLDEFMPQIVAGISTIDLTIPNNRDLRCLDHYEIWIRTAEDEVVMNGIGRELNEIITPFNAENLTSGTFYEVKVDLIYKGESLHTYSQAISTLMDTDGVEMHASVDEDRDMVYLEWDWVDGAEVYEVGQHDKYEALDEIPFIRTAYNASYFSQYNCSIATYSMTPKRPGETGESVYSETVITYLNTTEPYIADNLDIDFGDSTTTITWDHVGPCVAHYDILLNEEKVLEHTVAPGDSQVVVDEISVEACKDYTLKLVPVFTNMERWEAEPEVQRDFKRLDDKNCVVPKVIRREEPPVKSPQPRVSQSSSPGSSALASSSLVSAIVIILARRC